MNDTIKLQELTREYLDLLRDKGFGSSADFYENNHTTREGQEKSEVEELEEKIQKLNGA